MFRIVPLTFCSFTTVSVRASNNYSLIPRVATERERKKDDGAAEGDSLNGGGAGDEYLRTPSVGQVTYFWFHDVTRASELVLAYVLGLVVTLFRTACSGEERPDECKNCPQSEHSIALFVGINVVIVTIASRKVLEHLHRQINNIRDTAPNIPPGAIRHYQLDGWMNRADLSGFTVINVIALGLNVYLVAYSARCLPENGVEEVSIFLNACLIAVSLLHLIFDICVVAWHWFREPDHFVRGMLWYRGARISEFTVRYVPVVDNNTKYDYSYNLNAHGCKWCQATIETCIMACRYSCFGFCCCWREMRKRGTVLVQRKHNVVSILESCAVSTDEAVDKYADILVAQIQGYQTTGREGVLREQKIRLLSKYTYGRSPPEGGDDEDVWKLQVKTWANQCNHFSLEAPTTSDIQNAIQGKLDARAAEGGGQAGEGTTTRRMAPRPPTRRVAPEVDGQAGEGTITPT